MMTTAPYFYSSKNSFARCTDAFKKLEKTQRHHYYTFNLIFFQHGMPSNFFRTSDEESSTSGSGALRRR